MLLELPLGKPFCNLYMMDSVAFAMLFHKYCMFQIQKASDTLDFRYDIVIFFEQMPCILQMFHVLSST